MPAADVSKGIFYVLDMGKTKYGDCILAVFGDVVVLIDGGHPGDWQDNEDADSIPTQLATILGPPPFNIDLLVVTHCHNDHIGCLPRLVKDGTLAIKTALVSDELLGFGRSSDGRLDFLDDRQPEVRGLVTALLEEDHSDLPDDDLRQFLLDAETLEAKYQGMLADLQSQGTEIVRYGRATSQQLKTLEKKFAPTGLQILGPTPDHLVLCAAQIQKLAKDAVEAIDLARRQDASLSAEMIYRRIMRSGAFVDLLDMYGDGSAKNCQSIVLAFGPPGGRSLLAADMQFAEPQVDDLAAEMDALKTKIVQSGPFAFVKLTHHTSYNGFDEQQLTDLGDPKILVHSGGWNDAKHPDRESLRVLKRVNRNRDIYFARTDRNGLIEVDLAKRGAAAVRVSKGNIDDFSPNTPEDVSPQRSGPPEQPEPNVAERETPLPPSAQPAAARPEIEVLYARLPNEPGAYQFGAISFVIGQRDTGGAFSEGPKLLQSSQSFTKPSDPRRRRTLLANGQRDLSKILFVGDPAALARNVGKSEAAGAIKLIEAGAEFLAVTRGDAIAKTNRRLQTRDKAGVVLVGGYDSLPSQRVDVLDAELRKSISVDNISRDPDGFVIWSDDAYADTGGDGFPDYPISRIPDGRSPSLLFNALTAPTPGSQGRFGIRNQERPFASDVFNGIKGTEAIIECAPTGRTPSTRSTAQKPHVYFMLHGDHADGKLYWGDSAAGPMEAVHVSELPTDNVGVVLAGCCWGALTVDELAIRSDGRVTPKIPAQSIALGLLEAGALAFVGCTGAHYSPGQGGQFFGEPMHRVFWRELSAGDPPASALYKARVEYLRHIPHGLDTSLEVGIERKIYKQFTCLGLGW